MNIKKLKLDNEEKKSKQIEEKLKATILDILDVDVSGYDVQTFRNKVLQAKVAMEYLRDIDVNFRIRLAQKLRIVSMVTSDAPERKQIIRETFS